jgi:succinate-semialdehyde dehydrogenase/glutarate-semialdehyde dehydrogenase
MPNSAENTDQHGEVQLPVMAALRIFTESFPQHGGCMPIRSFNPSDETVLETFEEFSVAQCDAILEASHEAFVAWRETPIAERARLLRAAAGCLRADRRRFAETMTREMGKPVAQAVAEVEKCAWVCEFYAEHGEGMLSPEIAQSDGSSAYVRFDPIGTVLAVMPWNFPYWQVFRFAAPTLMAGNAAVLKHASNVTRCALDIEAVFREAGFPPALFRTLVIGSAAVNNVIRHPRVAAVTLTGSEAAGASVAACAGGVIKKTVLELGGSDPFIVLADADLVAAATVAATARCINTGQSCIAAKRFIVEAQVAEEFTGLFVEAMRGKRLADPLEETTDIGPVAREDLLAELDAQVRGSISEGARLLLGGTRLDRPGFFYAATVLADVRKGMPAYDDEVFGPVAAVIVARDADDAVAIANDSPYGLGASVWTRNPARAADIARRLETGSVFVNGLVKSDPRLPFGGVKKSGYGRELSTAGIREFVNMKTVWIA